MMLCANTRQPILASNRNFLPLSCEAGRQKRDFSDFDHDKYE